MTTNHELIIRQQRRRLFLYRTEFSGGKRIRRYISALADIGPIPDALAAKLTTAELTKLTAGIAANRIAEGFALIDTAKTALEAAAAYASESRDPGLLHALRNALHALCNAETLH